MKSRVETWGHRLSAISALYQYGYVAYVLRQIFVDHPLVALLCVVWSCDITLLHALLGLTTDDTRNGVVYGYTVLMPRNYTFAVPSYIGASAHRFIRRTTSHLPSNRDPNVAQPTSVTSAGIYLVVVLVFQGCTLFSALYCLTLETVHSTSPPSIP